LGTAHEEFHHIPTALVLSYLDLVGYRHTGSFARGLGRATTHHASANARADGAKDEYAKPSGLS
jgi:hypothetical protein